MLSLIARSPARSLALRSVIARGHATAVPDDMANRSAETASLVRHSWTKEEISKIYHSPLLDLVFRAASVHRQHFDPSKVQLCTLMNIKSQ